ncbi:hypothetical protein EXIGLDRAFT_181008 [Exidia glandulosa HHB12029]|uniref:Uncharacterized protein n=1 Tax=Exidia glandulosa HHB12029 TaxID=1314781 RepID=A0A165F2I1_EXIGL|nr:hypothetical protein EXIGLDRAFT_181008 [Exidia glandulosa HHB12029]
MLQSYLSGSVAVTVAITGATRSSILEGRTVHAIIRGGLTKIPRVAYSEFENRCRLRRCASVLIAASRVTAPLFSRGCAIQFAGGPGQYEEWGTDRARRSLRSDFPLRIPRHACVGKSPFLCFPGCSRSNYGLLDHS